jgi:hypothetical protein
MRRGFGLNRQTRHDWVDIERTGSSVTAGNRRSWDALRRAKDVKIPLRGGGVVSREIGSLTESPHGLHFSKCRLTAPLFVERLPVVPLEDDLHHAASEVHRAMLKPRHSSPWSGSVLREVLEPLDVSERGGSLGASHHWTGRLFQCCLDAATALDMLTVRPKASA